MRNPEPFEKPLYYLASTYSTERGIHTHFISFRECQLGLQVKNLEAIVTHLLKALDRYVSKQYREYRIVSIGIHQREYPDV